MIHQPRINRGEVLEPVDGASQFERASYRLALDLKSDSSSGELALMEDRVRRAKLAHFIDHQSKRRLGRNSTKQDHRTFLDSADSADASASSNRSPPAVRSGLVETPARTSGPALVTAKSMPSRAAPESCLSLLHASFKSGPMSAPTTAPSATITDTRGAPACVSLKLTFHCRGASSLDCR